MLCPEYEQLSHIEKITMIGEAVHLLQQDSKSFNLIKDVIQVGLLKGLLDDVKILPESKSEQNY